ncbi:MAG: CoA transferase [Chloroflexi bacterium]|nr:CoA transferase [Chloroflexota bacterium]
MPERALAHYKVLDLTHYIAGPYATKLLADMGADVIKVERPAVGDPCRMLGPFVGDDPHPDKSLLFLYLNANKRGVTLDLKRSDGRAALKGLLQWADLVAMNYAPTDLPKLGLTCEEIAKVNPNAVVLSVTNFGLTGPYRDYKAWDLVEYALSGLMYIFGAHDQAPISHALHQAQFRAGTVAGSAALVALYGARAGASASANGGGKLVDVSIMEVLSASLRDTVSQYTYQGVVRRRSPRFGRGLGRAVAAADGYLIPTGMGAGADWEAFAEFLGAPELKSEKFATQEDRIRNAEELDAIITRAFMERSKMELFHDAHAWRFHFGVVLTPKEVSENEQLHHRGYFVEMAHPVAGKVTMPGASAIYSETPWQAASPAPLLGQHNLQVYRDVLDYAAGEIVALRSGGVI